MFPFFFFENPFFDPPRGCPGSTVESPSCLCCCWIDGEHFQHTPCDNPRFNPFPIFPSEPSPLAVGCLMASSFLIVLPNRFQCRGCPFSTIAWEQLRWMVEPFCQIFLMVLIRRPRSSRTPSCELDLSRLPLATFIGLSRSCSPPRADRLIPRISSSLFFF